MQEFYEDFSQQVIIRADSCNDFKRAAMAEITSEWLIDDSEIEGFTPAYYEARGVQVDGYDLSEQNDSIDLFLVDYSSNPSPSNMPQAEIRQHFKRIQNFFVQSTSKRLHEELEESSPAFGMAWSLHERSKDFAKIRFYLITNRVLSSKVDIIPDSTIDGKPVSFNVWDLHRLSGLQKSKAEPIVIDFMDNFGALLPCLPAHLASSDYKSYLVVMPGIMLADLYDRYRARLLEFNVRTFLQVRGSVNKGLRNTIIKEPHMFFAYNNGITATAESLETQKNSSAIRKIVNLQIVNGGQTTASLYHARRNGADLSDIFVQMKLSVVNPALSSKVVPKISEYANTQNKVSSADFFSNHPFHVRMEEMSRRILAPAVDGSQRQTKWFYERARGQYAEAQVSLTSSQKKAWQKQFPKSQLFTKTDLAKFENVWDGLALEANRGAQKNFSAYAERIGKMWEEHETSINDRYFKRAVARGIAFRATERIVSRQPWYQQGGYRANIVAYTQALLGHILGSIRKVPDWDGIWARQRLSEAFEGAIAGVAEKVNASITAPTEGTRNVTEWCKRTACWDRLKNLDISLPDDFLRELLTLSEERERAKDAEVTRTVDNGIEAQKKVLEFGSAFWMRLDAYCRKNRKGVTDKERGVLTLAMGIPRKIPSDKQSVLLLGFLERMECEGFDPDESQ